MINKLVSFLLCFILTGFASCVKEEGEVCSSYVRFVYDYNMAFENLFHKQASRINLYLFNDEGVFIRKISDECTPEEVTFPEDYRIKLPQDLPYPLHIVAWVGLDPETCRVTEMKEGVSTRNELVVQLNSRENNLSEAPLQGLWYGSANKTDSTEEAITIRLTKNTNSIRIILQAMDSNVSVNAEDFSFSLQCVNGSYDHTNCSADGEYWNYLPFYKANDTHSGTVAELHTLRLFDDRENRLQLAYEPQSSSVKDILLDVDLNNYINAFRLQEHQYMPLQEYMDREDSYKILIFITSQKEPNGDEKYIAADVQINDWYIREQED